MSSHGGTKKGLFQNAGTGQGLANLYSGEAGNIGAVVTPALEAEAINPSGYTPTQMAAQTTANEQSAGGANAGATGQALLRAARTRNIGGGQAATSQAAQNAGENLSQRTAALQARNADLQQRQRQEGLSGLAGLYGENVGAGLGALNASTGALNDAGRLSNFWQDLLMQGIKSGGQVASAYAMGG